MHRPEFLKDASRPVWVAITGNVRSGAEFRKIFHQAARLREQGLVDGILFSTWQSDLDSAPGLEAALIAAGIVVIGLLPPPPDPKIHPLFHGYLFHQRKSLRFALDALPTSSYILKARTDLAEERFDSMVEAIFGGDAVDLKTTPENPVLESRLFTFDARPDYFFYWDDIVFSGTREDLIKLNNFDIASEVVFPGHMFSAECSLYAPLFLSHYPILRWFFENTDGEKFARMLGKWISANNGEPLPELVIRVLASYFHILTRYLILPTAPSASGNMISLGSVFTPNDSLGVRAFPQPWASHKLFSNTLLDRMNDPDIIEGDSLEPIREMMQDMDAQPSLRGEIPSNLDELIHAFELFDRKLGTGAYTPQYRKPNRHQAVTAADLSSLDSIRLPEKRHLSWSESKILGARRKLAEFAFKKLL